MRKGKKGGISLQEEKIKIKIKASDEGGQETLLGLDAHWNRERGERGTGEESSWRTPDTANPGGVGMKPARQGAVEGDRAGAVRSAMLHRFRDTGIRWSEVGWEGKNKKEKKKVRGRGS